MRRSFPFLFPRYCLKMAYFPAWRERPACIARACQLFPFHYAPCFYGAPASPVLGRFTAPPQSLQTLNAQSPMQTHRAFVKPI